MPGLTLIDLRLLSTAAAAVAAGKAFEERLFRVRLWQLSFGVQRLPHEFPIGIAVPTQPDGNGRKALPRPTKEEALAFLHGVSLGVGAVTAAYDPTRFNLRSREEGAEVLCTAHE